MTNMIPYRNDRVGMPSLLGWDPMQLFDDLVFGGETLWNAMPIKAQHDDDHVTLTVDLPGVDLEDVDLTFERGTLTIAAKRDQRSANYRVDLGDAIDPDSIEAKLDKGVLTVKAAKRPETKPRKIALTRGSQQPAIEAESK